jgi:hypothetical protein
LDSPGSIVGNGFKRIPIDADALAHVTQYVEFRLAVQVVGFYASTPAKPTIEFARWLERK